MKHLALHFATTRCGQGRFAHHLTLGPDDCRSRQWALLGHKHSSTSKAFEAEYSALYTVLIALYSAEYPLLLLIHHFCITLSAKMTVGKAFPIKIKKKKKKC